MVVRPPGEGEGLGVESAGPHWVYVSDASVDAERVAQELRARQFAVADVPVASLVARCSVERPRVVLLDADDDAAVEVIERLVHLAPTEPLTIFALGAGKKPMASVAKHFVRPVDVLAVVTSVVDALRRRPELDTPGVGVPEVKRPSEPVGASAEVLGSGSLRPPKREAPSDAPRRQPGGFGLPLSRELEKILLLAERRVGDRIVPELAVPTPEEEIELVLPPTVLDALDEPIDLDDDEFEPFRPGGTQSPPRRDTMGPEAVGKTLGGTQSGGTGVTTGSRALTESQAQRPRNTSAPPSASALQPPSPERGNSARPAAERALESAIEPARAPRLEPEDSRPPSVDRPHARSLRMATVLAPGDAPRLIAQTITERATGVLTFESNDGRRAIVYREGDIVTAASEIDSEGLVPFLAARGDLSASDVERLAGKLPSSGRHAVASLIAKGHLRQEHLWPVLRAHAEYVVGRAVRAMTGTCLLEDEPTGRLRTEPGVFGSATGAEVFIDVVRRTIQPEQARERLGGDRVRIADGPRHGLFAECGFSETEAKVLLGARGSSLAEFASRGDSDAPAVVYGLVLLGVLAVVRSIGEEKKPAFTTDLVEEDAVRSRILARLGLVEEGDYFAILGVARDATGYEIRRAFIELRKSFEPTRILTPGLVAHERDVHKILFVLEEAYDVLREPERRERYRRAIEEPG